MSQMRCETRTTANTHAFIAVGWSVVRDVLPRQRHGLAQDMPILLSFAVETYNRGFNPADA